MATGLQGQIQPHTAGFLAAGSTSLQAIQNVSLAAVNSEAREPQAINFDIPTTWPGSL